jgi:SAM-dependent methyltransferase
MSMHVFKDNFSKQSDLYVKYRPLYPTELYSFLASLSAEHQLAWDCGTGNGQAAIGLADFYDRVFATDPSAQQISNAFANEKVTYAIEKAEQTSLASNSVDLLTIANALHWFDFDIFYKEAKRVLKKNGIIAAWAYGTPEISAEIDPVVKHFHDHTLGEYWLAENRLVEARYTTIPFPFPEIPAPEFIYEKRATLDEVIGGFNTWSATQRFINTNGFNPTEKLREELKALWPDNSEKTLTWKLILKVGRIS